jgi:hypothetical protein
MEIGSLGRVIIAPGFKAVLVTRRAKRLLNGTLGPDGYCLGKRGAVVGVDQGGQEKLHSAAAEKGLHIGYPSFYRHARLMASDGIGIRFFKYYGIKTFVTLEFYDRSGGMSQDPRLGRPRFYFFDVPNLRLVCDDKGRYSGKDIERCVDWNRHGILFVQ